MINQFKNRKDAGKQLAKKLKRFKDQQNCIIIGLPRGGIVTAFEVATTLNLPLDIVVPRKIGAPNNPEMAIGAVTEDGSIMLDEELVMYTGATKNYLDDIIKIEIKEAKRRLQTYRGNKTPLNLQNKTIIIVDDGIATGSTIFAAITSCKKKGAKKIVLAIPVAPQDSLDKISQKVDSITVITIPTNFTAISVHYDSFEQTSDEEVIKLLSR